MMKRVKHTFLLRFTVVFILHLLFKQGDKTFVSVFEISNRSLFFSLFFIIYWLLFWELCARISTMFFRSPDTGERRYRRLALLSSVLLFTDIIFVFLFNWVYLFCDYHIFNNKWDDIHLINPEFFDPSPLFDPMGVNPEMIMGLTVMFLLVLGVHLFITSIRNVKGLELLAEQQKKESIMAKYSALKNQIDPHFFFNSLSVLSSLVYEDTELSALYISHLSKHYRYVLDNSSDDLVPVYKELECLDSYLFLIRMRYPDSITVGINLSEATQQNYYLLSHSLQMLVENAVKHNSFTREQPLDIRIYEDTDFIIVTNNLSRKKSIGESTGVGLTNIKSRYAIETPLRVKIEEDDVCFRVSIPIIKIKR